MSFSVFDHQCMAMALREAEKGLFTAHPNPRVGCVIAADGKIVASGWHQRAGHPHAEVIALQQAGELARGATAYVTLEPCSHHGRTPPCAEALVAAGIGRVVMAQQDPHHQVNGAGASFLQQAGVTVESGLMTAAAEALNPGFLMRMRSGRPWVRVKVATSLDGRTALYNGESQWITGSPSRQDVQKWRARSCAIMTGIGTVLADDPSLTARVNEPPLQPLRVVVDTGWRTPPGSKLLNQPGQTLIAGSEQLSIPDALTDTGADCQALPLLDGRIDLNALLRLLAERQINELQVEAGARLCGGLLTAGLVDEILLYQAPILMGDGAAGAFTLGPLESMQERTHLEVLETCFVGEDFRIRMRPKR